MREPRRKGPRLPDGVSLGFTMGGAEPATPSSRPAQVASLVQRAVQDRIVRGLSDPRFQGMVSVQEVRMSRDLGTATILVSVLPTDRGPLALSALKNAAGFFRSHLRETTRIRVLPTLVFELSKAAETAQVESAQAETAPEENP